jgi:hypothetical protein
MEGMPVVIERRFNGPPNSGHGGWSAGRAAAQVDGRAAEVTLLRPPPLETPLEVAPGADGGVELRDADGPVLAARAAAALALDGPPAVDAATARAASERFAWKHDHPFPTCFGCGPERDEGDALRLFAGPVGDGRCAVPWTPPDWTGDATVDPGYLWAALDCPSSAPVHGTISAPVVLGRFTVALERPVQVGAPHVIQSWLERSDGRKRHTAVALFDAGGERLACGRAVWIELDRPLGA